MFLKATRTEPSLLVELDIASCQPDMKSLMKALEDAINGESVTTLSPLAPPPFQPLFLGGSTRRPGWGAADPVT